MIDDSDWQRLARYISGEASTDEARATRAWIDDNAGRRDLHERMRQAWELSRVSPPPAAWNSSAAWLRLARRLDGEAHTPHATRPTPSAVHRLGSIDPFIPRIAFPRRWTLGLAAALALVVSGGLLARAVLHHRAEANRLADAVKSVPMNEVVTRRAQRASIQLADGTKISLNVASRLRYPQSYGATDRTLHLEGEAYFEVAHDTIPFLVHTAQSTVRDLGTRFVVTAYPSHPETRVVVSDGAVVLSVPTDSVTLTASTLGTVNAAGKLEAISGVEVADHLAWIEGRLVFVGAPLQEVVQRLSRWYNIDVRLADAALSRVRFSGTFQTENPESVLRLLAASVGATVKRSGAAFVLMRQ